jgi:hypothetical protein
MLTYSGPLCTQNITMPIADNTYNYYNVKSCGQMPQTAKIRFCITAGDFNECDYTTIGTINVTH